MQAWADVFSTIRDVPCLLTYDKQFWVHPYPLRILLGTVPVTGYWLGFLTNTFNTDKMEEGMGIGCCIHCHCHESHTEIQIFTIKCYVCHVACAVPCPRVKTQDPVYLTRCCCTHVDIIFTLRLKASNSVRYIYGAGCKKMWKNELFLSTRNLP